VVTSGDRVDSVLLIWAEFHQTREPALRNRLVMQYAPLVKYVAGRMRTRLPESVDQDDLVSDGVLGLMDAIERFDPGRGLAFQTFAVPRIRGSIIDGMGDGHRAPVGARQAPSHPAGTGGPRSASGQDPGGR